MATYLPDLLVAWPVLLLVCSCGRRATQARGAAANEGDMAGIQGKRTRSFAALAVATALALAAGCGSGETRTAPGEPGSAATGESLALVARLAAPAQELADFVGPSSDGLRSDGSWLLSPGARSVEGLAARFPLESSQPFHVAVGAQRSRTLSFEPVGASAASVEIDGQRAIYPDAYPSTDLVVVARPTRAELLLVLHEASTNAKFTWRVTSSSGPPSVRNDHGELLFLASEGGIDLVMPKPFALDANGTRRDATLSWTDGRVELELDTHGLEAPILLDPALAGVWEQLSPATLPGGAGGGRYGHAMTYAAFGAAGNGVLMFGGRKSGSPTHYQDTWMFNGTDWADKCTGGCTATLPSARRYHVLAYDAGDNVAVLFGGADGGGFVGDTWHFSGTAWSQRCASGACGISARQMAAAAYYPPTGVTLLFGGTPDGVTYLGDAYTWAGTAATTTWSAVAGGPAARREHAMAYDSAHGEVVLFGGFNGTYLDDTWVWSGSWTKRCGAPAACGPPGRSRHMLAFDQTRGRVILYGGYNGGYLGDTWEWNGTTWSQTASAGPTGGRAWSAMAFDPARGRTVLFGGSNGGVTYNQDTWEYRAHGESCSAGSQCDTGYCVDNVCCDTASCSTCSTCDGTAPGTCTPIASGQDTGCTLPTHSCLNGTCKLTNGQACSPNGPSSACINGQCWDLTCCDADCSGVCKTCVSGVCVQVVNAPDDTCNGTMACDSGGACKLANGQACSPDGANTNCASGNCRDGRCCDTSCTTNCYSCALAGHLGTCWPITSGSDGTCTAPAQTCDNGVCKSNNGQVCAPEGPNVACVSGICRDGRCCNTDCTADCMSCGLAGTEGTCSPVVSGNDGNCLSSGGKTCNNGVCKLINGQACTPNGPNTACNSGQCSDNTCCNTACSGACDVCNSGTCTVLAPGATGTCTAYKCAGTANCPSSCSNDTDCLGGYYCDTTAHCVAKQGNGLPCSAGNECSSSYCVDNVCCNQVCNGLCEACSAANKQSGTGSGNCGPAKAGIDPGNQCADELTGNPTSCGQNGVCGASGQCALASSGKSCGATFCSNNNVKGKICDGLGTCTDEPTGIPCSPFVCSGSACANPCSTIADCETGNYCLNGQCVPQRPNGQGCNGDGECLSTFCRDSVCCNGPCSGQCEACDVLGSEGQCSLVANGQQPHGKPVCAGTGNCQGTCDGADPTACKLPAAGTSCGTGACNNDNFTPAGACDGAGLCVNPSSQPCAPYGCSSTGCNTSCTSNADCAAGAGCDGSGKCVIVTAICKDDYTVKAADGTESSCVPYKCVGGACQQQCTTTSDCAPGYDCQSSKCVSTSDAGSDSGVGGGASGTGGGAATDGGPTTGGSVGNDAGTKKSAASGDEGGCGCRAPSSSGGDGEFVVLGALLVAGASRRRSRRRARRERA
jgi:hypothetical protein